MQHTTFPVHVRGRASGSRAENGTGEGGLIIDPAAPALRHRWADAEDGWIHAYLHFSEHNASDRCAESFAGNHL